MSGSTMKYTAIVEKGPTSWGAYVPDLPGCIAAAESREEVLRLIREAVEFHIEGLRQQGEAVPEPRSFGELVEIGAA
jgi:predicted RNase H-like HicB family nuclease